MLLLSLCVLGESHFRLLSLANGLNLYSGNFVLVLLNVLALIRLFYVLYMLTFFYVDILSISGGCHEHNLVG